MATKQTRKRQPSAIPVGSQFSPDLVHLPTFVKALLGNSGDKRAVEAAVWLPAVRSRPLKTAPAGRKRSLPVESAVQYGLLDRAYQATALTARLASLGEPEIYEAFARHILLECGGLRVLQGIEQMEADNEHITGDTLARYLTRQGFTVAVHNTAINSLRLWLAKAGLFLPDRRASWRFDRLRQEELLGLTSEQVGILGSAKPTVHAFARALCREAPSGWVLASTIRSAAEANDAIDFGRGSLPNEVLKPLKAAGLIDYTTDGTGGGKSSKLRTTHAFDKEVLAPFVTTTVKQLDAAVADYYRRRPEDIDKALGAPDAFARGRALEAFAIMLMRRLGLRFVSWNKRAAEATAHAEVDVLLAGVIGTVPTRWQVQCKNTPGARIDLRDVASEVGLLPITQATHVLMVANANFTADAERYACEVMRKMPVSIYLLGTREFQTLRKDLSQLSTLLRQRADAIDRLERPASPFARA